MRRSRSSASLVVRIDMPSVTGVVHDATGSVRPSTSTMQRRHAPTGSEAWVVAEVRHVETVRLERAEDRGAFRDVARGAVENHAKHARSSSR